MTEKKHRNMGAGPSTKRLRAMLKLMGEFGVARYKDSEVEIEVFPSYPSTSSTSTSFDFSSYDNSAEEEEEEKPRVEQRDDLGFTEDDYLWRSAEV